MSADEPASVLCSEIWASEVDLKESHKRILLHESQLTLQLIRYSVALVRAESRPGGRRPSREAQRRLSRSIPGSGREMIYIDPRSNLCFHQPDRLSCVKDRAYAGQKTQSINSTKLITP